MASGVGSGAVGWTFLTNHAHVLIAIARDPEIRLRDIAERVGITERAAQRIVSDLADGGYIIRERVGRRNAYQVNPTLPFRHPLEHDHDIGELLGIMDPPRRKPARRGGRGRS